MKEAISIKNLSKRYGSLDVLDKLNLSIAPGEFICLLGESGCGKSTLIRILAGIEPFDSGEVEIENAALMTQQPTLLPWLSVRENIALPFHARGIKPNRSKLRNKIEMTGLSGFESAKPKELSGGMAQRVALARALIHESPILLLDEPLSSLDPCTRLRMQQDLLRIWKERKQTIVMTTHDIDEAIALGTRIILFTPRPAKIHHILQNNRPQDRTNREVKNTITQWLINETHQRTERQQL